MNKIACRYDKLLEENVELAEALQRQTAIQTADQISATEIKLIIPKEKFQGLLTAIQRSKTVCYLTFDKSRAFLRADPDIFVGN
jgi:dsDNA-binding SOS-regulon protein